MDIPFGNLKRHYQAMRDEIDAAMQAVFDSGWFVLGAQVDAFERAFAAWCGCAFGVGVGSGTEALHLGLVACGVRPGDEVITVAHTAVPTASAISFAGARPVFVDVDSKSYTMDPTRIEAAITPRTRAIVPVHLYGQAANLEAILDLAGRRNLRVIEDCAQAHGAKYGSHRVGSLGDVGCFSFYPSKNLGAFGDGGMVVTNNTALAERLRKLRNYGSVVRDRHDVVGYNSRLDELQAAVLNAKLPHLDTWNARRREIAALYRTQITHPQVIHPQEMDWGRCVYHLYVIQTDDRDGLRESLRADGIGTGVHFPIPVHKQPAYADLKPSPLPVTEKIAERIVSLPIYPELTDDEVAYVARGVMNAMA